MNADWMNDTGWTQRYESLREHFLGGAGRLPSAPLGLVLLLGQGLAAWMRGWNPEPAVWVPRASGPTTMLPLPASGGWQRELTFVLAQITTVHLQPTVVG